MFLSATLNRFHHSLRCFATASFCIAIALSAAESIAQGAMSITSPAFADNATIPARYACNGGDSSPPLKWSGVPAGAKVLALIVEDPDAPGGTFIHWVAYNMPPSATGLESGVARGEAMPDGGKQGINGFKKTGYSGPCPPPGSPHHYHFRLFALDQPVDPHRPATASDLENAMKDHIKASAELVGIFGR